MIETPVDVSLATVERTDASVLTIRQSGVQAGWEQWYLLIADVHWDNPHCRRDLLARHLDQARERKARVMCFGDWFCAMQGKYDPRRAKRDIRPEHNVANYLDAIISDSARWLEPWADLFDLFSDGNHEWSIEDHLETSLTQRLVDMLNGGPNAPVRVHRLYEWGFLCWRFSGNGGRRTGRNAYFHHGYGGGGPVTRGVIQTARRNAYIDNVDFIITGHIHERWDVQTPGVRPTDSGKVEKFNREHLNLGTYKDEYTPTGWHTRQGRPPKPLGGYWLHFFHDGRKPGRVGHETIKTD